ncbi:MAG: methyltransferase domain-containing protein [Candidatus Limnocylindrales bacterium]
MGLISVVLEEQKNVLAGAETTVVSGLAFAPNGRGASALPADWECLPQFDRYLLMMPADSVDVRSELLKRFYDFIAPEFERLADRSRNLENISYLLAELEIRCGPLSGLPILDLGSGTGLSLDLARALGIDVVGVEISAGMAQIASSRGMPVLTPGNLGALPEAAGAIASYVLHFGIPPETLRAVLTRLAPSGLLLGNVHHGTNLDKLTRATATAGGQIVTWTPKAPLSRHGLYVAIGR